MQKENVMIQYKDYLEDINIFFKNKNAVLATDLKKHLKLEDKGRLWGSLLSALISKKILEKDTKFEIISGNKVYYYKLFNNFESKIIKSSQILILDQFGNSYECLDVDNISLTVKEILSNKPSLELSVYKKINSYKAKISIIDKGENND